MLNLSVITCILYYITFCTSFLKESCNTGKWSRGFFLGGGLDTMFTLRDYKLFALGVDGWRCDAVSLVWFEFKRRLQRKMTAVIASSKYLMTPSQTLSLSPLPLLSAYLVRCVFDLLLLNKLSTHLICVRNIISSGTHQRFEPVSENRLFVPLNTLIRFYSAFYIMGHRFGFCFTA